MSKRVSLISSHINRKGKLISPFNYNLGEQLKLSSWIDERLPEYLWMGIILREYERKEGLRILRNILYRIIQVLPDILYPKFSLILNSDNRKKEKIFQIITEETKNNILMPLTIIYQEDKYPIFNKHFYSNDMSYIERMDMLNEIIDLYFFHQSNEATDLQFLTTQIMVMKSKICIHNNSVNIIEALKYFETGNHSDDKMGGYRSLIRSFSGLEIEEYNIKFCEEFWRDIGMVNKCEPIVIDYEKNMNDNEKFIASVKEVIKYIVLKNKELRFDNDKFDIVMGNAIYGLKIYIELSEANLSTSIIGRLVLRTLIEIYINFKYLLKLESEKTNIWTEYKLYGIEKLKLVLLKSREQKEKELSHISHDIIEAIVNEDKWEELVDVDLKYFDNTNIRKKFEYINEKDLYLYYDYLTNYSHGFWGAIRESSMLHCHNPGHKYHYIPDINFEQMSSEVYTDCEIILRKIMDALCNLYEVPHSIKVEIITI